MIKLIKIQVEGFCSIVEPQTISLNVGGTVLIKAPNGYGKTTLFSSVAWGLFGKNLKGKTEVNTWKKYRPSDYSGTKVEVIWESDKGIFKVIRCQNYTKKLEDGAKGGNRVILIQDGDTLKVKGKLKIQEVINRSLGCSFELFTSSIMFGQGMKRLIQESNADKKKIFEEVFNLEYLTVAKTIAQDERNQVNSEYKEIESEAQALEREIKLLERSYQELKKKEDSWTKQNKEAVSKQKKRLKEIDEQIKDLEAQIEDIDYGERFQNIKKFIANREEQIEEAEQIQDTPLLQVVQDTINLLEASKTKQALSNLRKILSSFEKAEKLRIEVGKARKKLENARDNYRRQDRITQRINDLQLRAKDVSQEIIDLQSTHVREVSPKYLKKLKKAKKSLSEMSGKRETLKAQLENYNWVLNDPLSNNGIKAFLFDSSLQALNSNLEKYADTLGFRIEFNVDLDSARKEFVTLIERDGIIIEYDELSGGEKGLVNLTMCLALHETLTLSKGINILLLDEVFENLDADNIELVISLIRTLSEGKTVFIISHIQNLPFSNCKALEVCKNNGQTHYSPL